jgi:uncharacterized protein (UPF0332 family)
MSTDLQALLHKVGESHRAAVLLEQEGFPDFAASRAYYAMLYIAEAFLLDLNMTFVSHAAIIAAFGKEFAKTGKVDPKFHRYLIDAQGFRNQGDYGFGIGVTQEQAVKLIEWAKDFITLGEQKLKFE